MHSLIFTEYHNFGFLGVNVKTPNSAVIIQKMLYIPGPLLSIAWDLKQRRQCMEAAY